MFQRTKPPQIDGRSTAAQFLDEHDHLVSEVMLLTDHNTSLLAQNAALLSEVNMLREELDRSDHDRVRIQGFAAGLAARLSVIQETISVALREAASHKIKPEKTIQQQKTEDIETAEIRDLVARLPNNVLTN